MLIVIINYLKLISSNDIDLSYKIYHEIFIIRTFLCLVCKRISNGKQNSELIGGVFDGFY